MKNKIKFITFIVITILLFAACSRNISNNIDVNTENTDEYVHEIGNTDNIKLLSKQNGLCGGSSSENGYYYFETRDDGSFNLMYIDYETKQSIILCASPNCTHNNENCRAWFNANQGGIVPIVTNDKLMILSRGVDMDDVQINAPKIEVMELNGANRKIISKFDSADEIMPPFAGNEDFLFYILKETNEVNKIPETRMFLAFTDLSTGETNKLHDLGENLVNIVGASNNNILLKSTTTSTSTIECSMFIYSIDNNELIKINSWENYDKLNFSTKTYYGFIEKDATITYYRYDDSERKQHVIKDFKFPLDITFGVEMTDFFDSYDDTAVFRNVFMGKEPSDRTDRLFVINFDNEEFTDITLKSYVDGVLAKPIEIVSELDEHLLVITASEFKPKAMLSKDGVPFQTQMLCDQYSVITKSDYWNSNPKYSQISDIWF